MSLYQLICEVNQLEEKKTINRDVLRNGGKLTLVVNWRVHNFSIEIVYFFVEQIRACPLNQLMELAQVCRNQMER